MTNLKNKFLFSAFISLFSLTVQAFPNKPITIVVPASAGGATDIAARMIAVELSKITNTNVNVQNRAGAHAVPAMQYILNSGGDGHTLYMAYSGFHTISPNVVKLPFDTMNDVKPVALVKQVPGILVVRSDSKIDNYNDFLSEVKNKSRKFSYGTGGQGVLGNIVMETIKLKNDLDIVHVPFKGVAPAITDLIGGQIDMVMSVLSAAVPHIQSGRLKPIFITSSSRLPVLPNTPHANELGLSDAVSYDWFAIYVNKQTPDEIVKYFEVKLKEIVESSIFKQKAESLGGMAVYMNSAELDKFGRAELLRWHNTIKKSNIIIE